MAKVHNALSWYTHLSRAYKNALGLGEGGLERAGETLTPTFPLFEEPTFAIQRLEFMGSVGGSQTAGGAGQYGAIGLGLPADSRYLLTIDPQSKLMPVAAGQAAYVVELASVTAMTSALANSLTIYSRDTRMFAATTLEPFVSHLMTARRGVTGASLGPRLQHLFTSDTSPSREAIGVPYVISPGWALAKN